MAGLFSVKSDVFSFGVLLLEIIYGKRNGEFVLSEHMQSLLLYVSFYESIIQRAMMTLMYFYIFQTKYFKSSF
jgi:hypothetical protein